MSDQNTPTAESDTPRGPLTNDREVESILNAILFPSTEDTTESVEAASEPEAGLEAAEEEEQPAEVEASAETETEESEETQEQETVEAAQPRKLRIPKEDGTHEEVDEEEAVKGYMRREDYTRKRMAEAEREKEREAEFARVREERQRYAAALPEIEKALKPETPDWDKVRQESPEEFPAIYAAWQVAQHKFETVRAERERAEQQVLEDRRQQFAKVINDERAKLLEKAPELKEPTTVKALGDYLRGVGFTDEEIAGTSRHELLVMARKAQLYDEMAKNKPKIEQKVEQKIKPAKPGTPASTKPKVSELERDANRLKKTGSVDDLAKVLNRVMK